MIFSFTFYSLVVFNDGTIQRYRLSLMLFILFGYNLHKSKILNEKNKVLIVGYGSAAKRHISNFNKIKKNTNFFILSRKKKILLKDNKINFKHIRKINEIYTEDLNYSFICTGANEHFKYLNILSKIKKNIFIEKPIVNTTRMIKELRKIYKTNKNKIYVGYNLLFSNSLNF